VRLTVYTDFSLRVLIYGIGTSVMIAALYAVAVYADRMALRQALLLCFAIYTARILVLVWRCASNAKEKF
jgi:hypothetical protein